MNGRIRSYQPDDFAAVVDLVQANIVTLAGNVKSFLDGAEAFVFEEDGAVRGLAVVTKPITDHGRQAVRFRLCTDPQHRRRGIGSQLWRAIEGSLRQSGAELVTTSYRCDRDDARRFFTDRGFKPWFMLHDLIYTGPAFPEPALDAIHYEDRYFADYLTMINDGFTDMRRTNDIEPNVIFGPDSFSDDKLRQEMLANRDNLYVFLVEGEMIGLLELESGPHANAVDTLAVKPSHRGRGYGRAITQFSINRVRERGVHKVYIGVVDTNTAARRLYESLGCTLEQSVEQARLWLPGATATIVSK